MRQVTLQPTRGAAGFWFGLRDDGVRDDYAGHGGCPVIAGTKWILNKWINSFNQWDRIPCSRRPVRRVQPWPSSHYH